MHHFFVDSGAVENGRILLTGTNYDHAVSVLRLREGEALLVSDSEGRDYECRVDRILREEGEKKLIAMIQSAGSMTHELPAQVWLFQSLPKSDKMELIIQKAVELGVSCIVPVMSRNCVVKLEEKKVRLKTERWQKIAQSAAEQSQRSVIPKVYEPVSFTEAVRMAAPLGVRIIPYENAEGLTTLCEAIVSLVPGVSVGVFIGPEGGYDPLEVKHAENNGIRPVSLGKRILRTETAALAVLSLVMIRLEIAGEAGLLEE